MCQSIAAVRRCATYLISTIRRQVVQTLVLCLLDYCSVIWASAPKPELSKNRAARLTLDCFFTSNIDQMHSRLRWPKVINRLTISLLVFIRNTIHAQYSTALVN